MILPYVSPEKRNWQVGDRCTVKLNFREHGVIGGWATYHYHAEILKVNKKTVRVSRVGWDDDWLVGKDRIY